MFFDMSLRVAAAGPSGIPLANNLRFLARSPGYLLRRMEHFSDQPVVPVTGGNGSVLLLRGPSAARQMFTDNETFHRPEGILSLPPGRPWSRMFEAVITANGGEHTRRRKLLMPAVHRTAIEHYTVVFARTFAASRFATAGVFDARAEFLRVSKANMLRCLLGLEPTDELAALSDVIVRLGGDALSPGVVAFKRDLPGTPYRGWLRRVAWAHERLVVLIDERRTRPPQPDALSILCHTTDEAGDHLTTDEIVGELHGFFSAGFETTAMTMTVALLTLIASPDPADAETPDPASHDPAALEPAIKEAQRIMPVVPLTLPRHTVRPVTVGSTEIPAGALVFASALLEHRDAEVYPEPERYRPSRWSERAAKPYEFMPFGLGPRRCLGAEFADAQIRTTLRLIAENGLPTLLTTQIGYGTVNGVVAGPAKPVVVDTSTPATRPTRVTGSVTAVWKG